MSTTNSMPRKQQQASPKISTRVVSPAMAKKWLGGNSHNRNLRPSAVHSFAQDMLGNNWRENGETIKFASNGMLLDGQHRLAAIIEADVSVRMIIVEGLTPEDQETIDTGNRRTMGDILRLRGEINCNVLGALLRRIWLYKRGVYSPQGSDLRPTPAQLLAVLESRRGPSLREAVKVGMRLHTAVGVSASTLALCYWVCHEEVDKQDAEFFFGRLLSGENLVVGDPVHTLRSALIERARKKIRGHEDQTAAMILKCWNGYRAGRRVTKVGWVGGGVHAEAFPVPR